MREVNWPRDTAAVARSLARAEAWFWLDGSAVEPGGSAGVSYLGETTTVLLASKGHEREFLQGLCREPDSAPGGTGWVVALGYEFGVGLMGEDPAVDTVPPAFALRPSTVLVLNHSNHTAEIRGKDDAAIDAWLGRHGPAFGAESPVNSPIVCSPPAARHSVPPTVWRRSDTRYLEDVRECKRAIREGEAYVLCLTDTAEIENQNVDPLNLYLELLNGGAAIRGGILVAGDRALVSASPERFLSKRGETIATHPIKGTRARGETPEADVILADQLATDPKERAENLMIVDLMRNDLSRVCAPGSLRISGFLQVETHPRVHQLVSSVIGQIRDDANMIDAIEACFPGGSMTGAPKRRAVQLLSALEGRPRGLYSGCFGWLGDDGNAELAMSIRCIELRGEGGAGQRALVGAGGGVTIDSDPDLELAEKMLKSTPLLAALKRVNSEYP